MRYVIYGAGAIGGTIAAGLHDAGFEVAAIARGPHLEAIRRSGLRVNRPDGATVSPLTAAASADELEIGAGDVVVIAVKSQHTDDVLAGLAGAHPDVTVVCAQNGVDNERRVLRSFANVIGMYVWMASDHLEPGVVGVYSAPPGVLDVGRYPSGVDAAGDQIAADLRRAGFDSLAVAGIMRWKHRKLLGNLGNAVQALLGPEADDGGLTERARAEGVACYAAAGIEAASGEEQAERVRAVTSLRPASGRAHRGGSSWQSVVRGTGSIETDHLNGEIVLLGRLHGVPTPVNELLQRRANQLVRGGGSPGELSAQDLLDELAAATG